MVAPIPDPDFEDLSTNNVLTLSFILSFAFGLPFLKVAIRVALVSLAPRP